MDFNDFRPNDFKSLIMPKQKKRSLISCIDAKTLPRRMAIFGPTGSGKSTLAQLIAKAINCKQFNSMKDICGKCGACLSPTDLKIIDCADPKARSSMLSLLERINWVMPSYNKRVIVLDEAQTLSRREQASLLLPIENLGSLQVILCSSRIDDISIPLRNRFVPLEMSRPTQERAFRYYRRRLLRLNVDLCEDDLIGIIKQADRLPREIVRRILETQFAPILKKVEHLGISELVEC